MYITQCAMQPRKIWGDACEAMVGRESSQNTQAVFMNQKKKEKGEQSH